MPDLKLCPVEGCSTPVKRDKNMCRRHWMSLPTAMRNAHWSVYREFQDARDSDNDPERLRMAAQALRDSIQSTAEAAAEIEARGAA